MAAEVTPSATELELVEKVFLKIVLAETDDQFETSLNGFLAPILLKLASRNDLVKNKILELLTHVNRRLKSRPKIQLPLLTLITQFKDDKVPATVRNFSIIYIRMAYQRADKSQQLSIIPELFSCLMGKVIQHQYVLLQCILLHINEFIYPESIEERKSMFWYATSSSVMQTTLDYFADFLLLPYNMQLNMDDASVVAPPSLNKTIYNRLKTDPIMTIEQIEQAKLGIIKFLASEILEANFITPLLVIASSDSKHSVSEKAEHMLKKFASSDLWEEAVVMTKLLKFYQGSLMKPGNLHDTKHSSDIRSASSKRTKIKIYPYFLKSKNIVDMNPPLCLQVIFEGLFGDNAINKIKQFSLEFIHHTCFYCSEKTMSFMGPLLYQALCRVALDKNEDVKLRSLAFSGFSKISRRSGSIFRKDIAIVQKLFSLLEEEEEADIRLSIQDTLSSISSSYFGLTGTSIKIMETLLLSNVESINPNLRLASVQFANAAFPTTHVLSRYICLLCTGDSIDNIREEALRGLKKAKSNTSNCAAEPFFPNYCEIVDYLYLKINERKSKTALDTNKLIFPVSIYEKLLVYLRECLLANSDVTEQDVVNSHYLFKLKKFLSPLIFQEDVTDLYQISVGRHISLLQDALIPTGGYQLHVAAVTNLLEMLAAEPERLCSLFQESLDYFQSLLHSPKDDVREATARLLSIIFSTLPHSQFEEIMKTCISQLNNKVFEVVHANILLIGYTLSRFSRKSQDIEGGKQLDVILKKLLIQFLQFLYSKLKDTNVLLSCASCVAIGEICKQFVLPIPNEDENNENVTKHSILDRLSSLLHDAPETKLKEKAATALGFMSVGDRDFRYREKLVETLIESSQIRQPELHFTIGEAFSCVGAGSVSKASHDQWSVNEYTNSLPPHKTVMVDLLKKIVKESILSTKPYVRQAGAIWLLCIVKYSSKHPGLQEEIKEVQTAFVNLLSDNDEVTQDIASRGLGLVYDLVEVENKDELVSILVDRLMSGKRPKLKVEAETEIFKPGALGASPEGSKLSTYKELCSLATSLNRPDLMYKFMNLANHNAMWNSRKGAAFGFLSIASLAGAQLKPYLPEILPKLYRYQYDPNVDVQRAMGNIWNALVPDGKKAVDQYTKEIMADILQNITSNTWRIRESCCTALNELIRTSSAEDIVEKLSDLWKVAFRVMDDIKESVRKAATTLAKTLSRLSIRICNVTQSKLGEVAVRTVLPTLLDFGLSSRVSEVKDLSLQTLVQVTKHAGNLIRPHIPQFVCALLESLSGLEPQYLNTLSLQLSQSQEAQDKLDVLRLSASKSSPMMEAVNFCVQYVDETVLSVLTPRLCDLLKTGLGLGTKVGCSTLVIQLTLQCRNQMTPFAGKFLAALLNGMNDRNGSVRKSYAVSVGHLIRYAKETSIEKVLNKITKWYLEKEDETVHFSCAWCINAMATYSPDTFYNYGSIALPLVFVAMQGETDKVSVDSEQALRSIWEEIWNNNTSGNTSAIKLYLAEIYTLTEPLLVHQSWHLRIKAARAIIKIADTLGSSFQQPHLNKFITTLFTALQGRVWTGKEILLKALSTIFVKCHSSLVDCIDDNMPSIDTIMAMFLKECKKERLVYKRVAIECSAHVIEVWKLNKFEDYKPVISSLVEYETDEDDDTRNAKKEEVLILALETLSRVWPFNVEAQKEHFGFIIGLLIKNLTNSTWKTQLAVCKTSAVFVERTAWSDVINWPNEQKDEVSTFWKSFPSAICSCIESSSYASVKLHGVKVLRTFYSRAQDCSEMFSYLNDNKERIVRISNQLSTSTNFDITNNIVELMKLIALLTT